MKLRFFVHHESCECKCRLNERVCNSKQKLNFGMLMNVGVRVKNYVIGVLVLIIIC